MCELLWGSFRLLGVLVEHFAKNCRRGETFIGNEYTDLFKRLRKSSREFRSRNLESYLVDVDYFNCFF